MSYVTLDDLRTYIGVADNLDDDTLLIAQTAADQMVDAYCGRSFAAAGTATSTRVYTAEAGQYVEIDDAATVTLVEVDVDGAYSPLQSDEWFAVPPNGVRFGQPWPATGVRTVGSTYLPTTIQNGVRVTAAWGWPSTPEVVKHAALMQAARLFKRRDSVMGLAGSPETGFLYLSRSMDPDVQMLLGPWRRGVDAFGGVA
jgi:hypothetical protein